MKRKDLYQGEHFPYFGSEKLVCQNHFKYNKSPSWKVVQCRNKHANYVLFPTCDDQLSIVTCRPQTILTSLNMYV